MGVDGVGGNEWEWMGLVEMNRWMGLVDVSRLSWFMIPEVIVTIIKQHP